MQTMKWIIHRLQQAAESWRAAQRRRRWTLQMQADHLRVMLQLDHRWLASDPTSDALTARYLAALEPDWYSRHHEDVAQLRSRLGLVPPRGVDPGPGERHG